MLPITDSDPYCSSNVSSDEHVFLNENDIVQLTCSVNYSGSWAPVMKWQQVAGPVITDGRVVNNTVPCKSVTYSLTVRATKDMNGQKYFCTTYFSDGNKPERTTAINLPKYNFVWSSQAVYVECELEILEYFTKQKYVNNAGSLYINSKHFTELILISYLPNL